MSKKLAEGLTGLVLDVKQGSGALMREAADSLELARTMIALGEDRGCPTVALLTAMDRPLGVACGNALETREAILALRGEGPEDLMEATWALGGEMLLLAGVEPGRAAARKRLEATIASGDAARRLGEIITAQGGDPRVMDDPDLLPRAPRRETFSAPASGVVARVEPRAIGRAIVAMGGGRQTVEDVLDFGAGFEISVKPGDPVKQGQPLAVIHGRDDHALRIGREALQVAIQVASQAPRPLPLVSHRVTRSGVEVMD
jgi:thymidine phosphorylase